MAPHLSILLLKCCLIGFDIFLESFVDVAGDPAVCVDVESLNVVPKVGRCLQSPCVRQKIKRPVNIFAYGEFKSKKIKFSGIQHYLAQMHSLEFSRKILMPPTLTCQEFISPNVYI